MRLLRVGGITIDVEKVIAIDHETSTVYMPGFSFGTDAEGVESIEYEISERLDLSDVTLAIRELQSSLTVDIEYMQNALRQAIENHE
jgi:hypothetical protein